MKKVILAISLSALSAVAAIGQTVDDNKKGEFFVGYSNGQVDTGLDSGSSARDFFRDRANFDGVNVSGVYNLNRYVGVKGDVSGTYNSTRFSETFVEPISGTTFTSSFDTSNSFTTSSAACRGKTTARAVRFKPFAHAMAGLGHARTKHQGSGMYALFGIAGDRRIFQRKWHIWCLRGGYDVRLNDKIQICDVQVDYNPIRFDGLLPITCGSAPASILIEMMFERRKSPPTAIGGLF